MDKQREAFEAWAKKPPREFCLARQHDTAAWPGNYKDYHVECAWQAWQAAQQAQPGTVKECLTVHPPAVAWAIFTKDGDCRIWFRTRDRADRWVDEMQISRDEIVPLAPLPPEPQP